MEYVLIFALIFAVLLWTVFVRMVKGALKTAFIVMLVFSLLMSVATYYVYQDVANFQEGFTTGSKLFLLQDEDYIVTGFSTKFVEDTESGASGVIPISDDSLKEYRGLYSQGEYETILGDNYKVFFFDMDSFQDVNDINLGTLSLDVDQVGELLRSSTPMKDFVELSTGQKIDMEFPQSKKDEIRSLLFGALFAAAVSKHGALFIVEQVREKNMIVYPETAMFKVLKYIPIGVMKWMFNSAIDAGKNVAITASAISIDFIESRRGDL